MVSRIRLLLADDHLETAAQLRRLLQPEFDVIGARHRRPDAGQATPSGLSPDVIVSDISMPDVDGITAAAAILRHNPDARIVLVTVHGDPSLVTRGLETGALGYVLKCSAGDDLVPAIRRGPARRASRQRRAALRIRKERTRV